MNICSNNHDEVCYEGRICPCCELLGIIKKHEDTIYRLEDEVADLNRELNNKED
jgi:hypothetical protein